MTTIGRNALCFGYGCHVVFYDTTKPDMPAYRVNGVEVGNGVQCITGHRDFPIFAYSELCLNPRIFIVNYPDLKILGELEGNTVLI